MAPSTSCIGSPNALGRISGPAQIQLHDNDKTIISPATEIDPEAKAKLREINKPMKSGTPITSSPNRAAMRYRATYTRKFGRTGSLSVVGQKRCAPRAVTSLSLVRTTRSCSRIQSRGDSKDNGVARVVILLCERATSASQKRQTGDTAAARPASNQDEP